MKSKYTSSASEAPKPAPETVTVEVGGPLAGESDTPGLTVNGLELVAVPPGVVTDTGPVDAAAGTVATIVLSECTERPAKAPLNRTVFGSERNPDPVIVTLVPIVPEAGEKDVIVGALANAGPAPSNSTQSQTAKTTTEQLKRRSPIRWPPSLSVAHLPRRSGQAGDRARDIQ